MSVNQLNNILSGRRIPDRIVTHHYTGGTHYFYFRSIPSGSAVDFLISTFVDVYFCVID